MRRAHVPAGWGAPVYAKLDAELAGAIMSINAVKGVEIGAGFAAARAKGEDNADPALAGGITGGISTGAPIRLRAAFKPPASVPALGIVGRHDPCVALARRAGGRGDGRAGARRPQIAAPRTMRRERLMLELILAMTLAAEPWDAPMTMRGIGELRIGTPAAALRAMGASEERYPDEEVDCAYWRTARWPGLAMMVQGGRIVRIETEDARYRTASGARVGMSEAEIRALYGARSASSRIPIPAPRAIIWSIGRASEPYGMIVETDGGRALRSASAPGRRCS